MHEMSFFPNHIHLLHTKLIFCDAYLNEETFTVLHENQGLIWNELNTNIPNQRSVYFLSLPVKFKIH